jgi:hypothetical protein
MGFLVGSASAVNDCLSAEIRHSCYEIVFTRFLWKKQVKIRRLYSPTSRFVSKQPILPQ